MKEVNLKSCNKEQLKKSLDGLLKKVKNECYIYLEDEYTDKPTLFIKANSTGREFGKVMFNIHDEPVLLNCFSDDLEGFYTTTEEFADELYNKVVLRDYQ